MQLIERIYGQGRIPVIEILVNSPKITKLIEEGHSNEILDEMESSVTYYKMQSMNQSLIALLVNGAIDYEKAMQLTADPEDLSLKLRKLFPQIEEKFRGGIMAPSANDFSAITELMDIKKLYEEAEEKWKLRMQEKEELISNLEADLQSKDRVIESHTMGSQELEGDLQKARQENERIRQEAAARIAQLNERIKELNNRIMGGAAPGQPQSGFFKK
jgi:septal ring factor EnvC (AmiA/AmiB activator)